MSILLPLAREARIKACIAAASWPPCPLVNSVYQQRWPIAEQQNNKKTRKKVKRKYTCCVPFYGKGQLF